MITIIVLLSFAVVVLVVLVALLILHNMHQGKELRQKNDVIVHEVRALWRICASPPTTWTWRRSTGSSPRQFINMISFINTLNTIQL